MSISVKELKKDILESNVPISVLLRRAILIAKSRGDTENEAWMAAELNGYEETGEPPRYRILQGQPMLHNRFVGWEVLHYQIADDKLVELLLSMPITGPIAQVEAYAGDTNGTMLQYGERFEQYLLSRLNKIGKPALSLTNTQFQKILEVVRNRLFEWVSQLPDEVESLPTVSGENVMTTENKWKDSVEAHPLRYALLLIIGTALFVGTVMGWVQKTREDNLTTRCETEKVNLKNDLEAQIRELKTQLAEAQKPKEIPK